MSILMGIKLWWRDRKSVPTQGTHWEDDPATNGARDYFAASSGDLPAPMLPKGSSYQYRRGWSIAYEETTNALEQGHEPSQDGIIESIQNGTHTKKYYLLGD